MIFMNIFYKTYSGNETGIFDLRGLIIIISFCLSGILTTWKAKQNLADRTVIEQTQKINL